MLWIFSCTKILVTLLLLFQKDLRVQKTFFKRTENSGRKELNSWRATLLMRIQQWPKKMRQKNPAFPKPPTVVKTFYFGRYFTFLFFRLFIASPMPFTVIGNILSSMNSRMMRVDAKYSHAFSGLGLIHAVNGYCSLSRCIHTMPGSELLCSTLPPMCVIS